MNGIWTKEDAEHHQSSLKFAKWLASYLPKDTPVVDFGCGNGYYVAYLESNGFIATGIDGNDNVEILCSSFYKVDLSQKLGKEVFKESNEHFTKKSIINASVISLEVGEHLPKSAQENFMQTLTRCATKHLILSWASIGQPGIGHINCRDQKEVIADVESRGFKLNEAATKEARANVDPNCDWLERNLLVFERI